MIQFVAHTATTPQVAEANDGVTNFFLLLAAGAFVVVVLRLTRVGELGSLTTVGSVIATVVVIALGALLLFGTLVVLLSLLTF